VLGVSVCIPTYNPDPAYLAAALASIATQVQPPVEVVVSDDASTNGFDPRTVQLDGIPVVVRRAASNRGMVGNWNEAVAGVRGDAFLLLHQDDVLLPDSLGVHVAALERFGAVQSAGFAEYIDEASVPWQGPLRPNDRRRFFGAGGTYVLDHELVTYLSLRNGQGYGEPPSVAVRTEAFARTGGWSPALRHAADVDMNIRLAALGPSAFTARPVLQRRWHRSNLTRTNVVAGHTTRERVELYERHRSALAPADRAPVVAALVAMLGFHAARCVLRRTPGAAEALRTAARLRPLSARALAATGVELCTFRNPDRTRTERCRAPSLEPVA
jgi:glycosyltransferase involved in cell wall biosynthesis